ncbi:MAG: replicative DNA helicase, partial [Acidimicrobiales bacterium]
TGFGDLDRLLGGIEPGALVVVGARPSMGKTGFGLCVARAAAARGTPALYTSAEMSEGEIMARLLGIMSGVGTHRQRSADLRPEEWMRLLDARKLLDSMPLEIDDRAAPTVSDIRLRARRMQVRSGLGLVVVDYLGLLSAPKAERRELEVAAIARGLKQIARSLGIVVVALSQLNRGLEARTDKRPLLSDLRESGAIEQDADVVAFIYRDEAYHPDSIDRGTAEIHVAKHRSGPTGVARLAWLPAVAKFADLDDRYVLR